MSKCKHGSYGRLRGEPTPCLRCRIAELQAENANLKEMVVRMYQHCTIEKAEMTQAESDEWLALAATLEKGDV